MFGESVAFRDSHDSNRYDHSIPRNRVRRHRSLAENADRYETQAIYRSGHAQEESRFDQPFQKGARRSGVEIFFSAYNDTSAGMFQYKEGLMKWLVIFPAPFSSLWQLSFLRLLRLPVKAMLKSVGRAM